MNWRGRRSSDRTQIRPSRDCSGIRRIQDKPKPKYARPLDYLLNLEFELLDIMLKRDAENEARENKEGDAKGWNSTVKYEASKKEQAALNQRLEANAIKRGDSVVTKP